MAGPPRALIRSLKSLVSPSTLGSRALMNQPSFPVSGGPKSKEARIRSTSTPLPAFAARMVPVTPVSLRRTRSTRPRGCQQHCRTHESRRSGAGAGSVLVVAPEPELPVRALVATLRRVIQDRVVAHQELQATPRGRVRVVHRAVLENERAEARALGHVAGGVRSGHAR